MAEGVKYNIKKLNGQNYESWNYLVKMLLINANLWDVVSTAVPAQTERDPNWKKHNDKALSKEHAHDAWEALKDYHQKASLSSMVFLLKRICRLSLEENGDMEAHISLFLELLNKLTVFGEEIKDRFAAGILLGSLPDSYSFLTTALESTGYGVQFGNHSCKIGFRGKVIANAKPAPDLYKLSTVEHVLSVVNEHSSDCQHTWHRRFGHRDIQAVKRLMETKMATGINIKDCRIRETCSCCVKEFVELTSNQSGRIPKVIRSDRGGEYVNNALREYLKGKGIKIQYTAGYSPEQNRVAERKNRSLVEMARCMLIDADLPNKFWGEAIVTANYLQNRLPTKSKQKTPFELWHKIESDVSNLQIFGSKVYVHIPKELIKDKFDKKAETMMFVGYSEKSKAYRLLNVYTERIKISRSVVFPDRSICIDNEVSTTLGKEEETKELGNIGKHEVAALENSKEIEETTEDSDSASDREIFYDTDISY
ncbi:uncharacterized protein [Euwallacea fornicatus]|uniref:uncharacterized protein n=1 Tax=Euwallacea fornicatus TaxID=995702 RepID=UPI00338FBCF9